MFVSDRTRKKNNNKTSIQADNKHVAMAIATS